MPMDAVVPSVENMCGLIIRSRLLQSADVQLMHRRWRLEAKEEAVNLERFGKWLVTNSYVTEYQLQALSRGHADHFFLNQYKLLDRIGKGRMAGVYKAVHNLGNIVAIKILPPSKSKDANIFARFQREAQMALLLKHPNVVRAFHTGVATGLYYLVMEYLEGETLEEVLKRRSKLPPVEGVRLIHQALLGLQHIHEKGMVHRDFKPANLMLVHPAPGGGSESTLQATVKILDIGLGRTLFDETAATDADELQLTVEGAMLGTPDYLAPEQARDAHQADIRADIYSLGCVLYHVLCGQVPFPDKNVFQQILRHAKETAKPIREIEPSVPEGLQQILQWMMAKDPNKRYATPERAAQALQVFLAGHESQRSTDAPPQLQSYLNWVDTQALETAPAGHAANAPASVPSTHGKAEPPASSPKRGPTPPAPQAKPYPTAPAREIESVMDVELVTVNPVSQTATPSPQSQSMGRREFVMLAIGIWLGAAGVLLVEGIIWLVWRGQK